MTTEGWEHVGEEPPEGEEEEEDEEPATAEPVSGRAKSPAVRAGLGRYSPEALDGLMVELAGRGAVAGFSPKE